MDEQPTVPRPATIEDLKAAIDEAKRKGVAKKQAADGKRRKRSTAPSPAAEPKKGKRPVLQPWIKRSGVDIYEQGDYLRYVGQIKRGFWSNEAVFKTKDAAIGWCVSMKAEYRDQQFRVMRQTFNVVWTEYPPGHDVP